jgi:thiamine-phosphate pyrophosphorylase
MSDSAERRTLARAAGRLAGGLKLPSLVLFCDDDRLPNPLKAVARLPEGAMVVVRSRDDRLRMALASAMAEICQARDLFVLVAADGALAAALGFGLHLPEARMSEIFAWRTHHRHLPITCAAHSLDALVRAAGLGADAAFLSPVFESASHPDIPALGAVRANAMVRQVELPVYALGGVTAQNAGQLRGFVGIAAISALS